MPSFETIIEQNALGSLKKGFGLSEPLADILRKTHHRQLITLRLDSPHGSFFSLGPSEPDTEGDELNLKTFGALCIERKNEKRFFFTMSDRYWKVLSAFKVYAWHFFSSLTFDISDPASTSLRPAIFKMADYFTVMCNRLLVKYIDSVQREPLDADLAKDPFGPEKNILRKIIAFSPYVQCVLLLDEDGFIVHSEGIAVDELASALAKLLYRSNNIISKLECADCQFITIADHEYTIRIGRINGTSLAFALSVGGPHATAYAYFLHMLAVSALNEKGRNSGQLWGVELTVSPESSRIRDSWFTPPRLVPHGKFAAKKGGKLFHTSYCQILAKTDASMLEWFESRTSALEKGMRPCGVCNP